MRNWQRSGYERRGERPWVPWILAVVLVTAIGAPWPEGALAQGEAGAATLDVTGAWARPGVEGANSAVYFQLHNRGSEPVTIAEARADVADSVELHRTVLHMMPGSGGAHEQRMMMEHLHAIEVAPGETVVLEPGGLHVMLLGLRRDLVAGDSFPLTLVATSGEGTPVEVPVQVRVGEP